MQNKQLKFCKCYKRKESEINCDSFEQRKYRKRYSIIENKILKRLLHKSKLVKGVSFNYVELEVRIEERQKKTEINWYSSEYKKERGGCSIIENILQKQGISLYNKITY